MAEDINESHQSEPENPQKVDNRLPYSKPVLRKHGKISDGTKTKYYC